MPICVICVPFLSEPQKTLELGKKIDFLSFVMISATKKITDIATEAVSTHMYQAKEEGRKAPFD